MKRLLSLLVVGAVLCGVAVNVGAQSEYAVYRTGEIIDVTTLQLGHSNVTATAGELNILDGCTATTANLNTLVAGGTAPAMNGAAITNLAGGNIASGDIGIARVSNALANAGLSTFAGNGSGLTNLAGGNIASGNIAAARIATGLGASTNATPLFRVVALEDATANGGYFSIMDTTQLVFITTTATNVLDSDIGTP